MVLAVVKIHRKRLAAFTVLVIVAISLVDVGYIALHKRKPSTIIRQAAEDGPVAVPEAAPVSPEYDSDELDSQSRLSIRHKKRRGRGFRKLHAKKKSGLARRKKHRRKRRRSTSKRRKRSSGKSRRKLRSSRRSKSRAGIKRGHQVQVSKHGKTGAGHHRRSRLWKNGRGRNARQGGKSRSRKSHHHHRHGLKSRNSKFSSLFMKPGAPGSVLLHGRRPHQGKLPHLLPGRPPVFRHRKLKPIDFHGRRMPGMCNCKLGLQGHGYCYVFVQGSNLYCKRRYCARKYVCVGHITGMKCIRRLVDKRVVPIGSNKCKSKYVLQYMYVPYTEY